MDVAVHYHNSKSRAAEVVTSLEKKGVRSMAVHADLTKTGDISAMMDEVSASFGGIDVLVNNAAVFRRTPPPELSEDDFDFHMDMNLKAPYLCSIKVAETMRRTGGGCIVNIADIASERPFVNYVPYCVSKAGLVMLTRSMARAFAPKIRVNAVAPGTVLFREDENEETREKIRSRIPRGVTGTPEDVARTVLFLCLDADHVTGAVIPVDGGRSLA